VVLIVMINVMNFSPLMLIVVEMFLDVLVSIYLQALLIVMIFFSVLAIFLSYIIPTNILILIVVILIYQISTGLFLLV